MHSEAVAFVVVQCCWRALTASWLSFLLAKGSGNCAIKVCRINCGGYLLNSYNMATRALADLSHAGTWRPNAKNLLRPEGPCYN